MPIHEYQCNKCEEIFERLEITKADKMVLPECPVCHSNVKRLISTSNFRLRGRGWARDGYSDKLTPENNPENKGNPVAIAQDRADVNAAGLDL